MSVPAGPVRVMMGTRERARPLNPPNTDRLDPADFARLHQEHWRTLWCAAAGIVGDRVLAQDIVQQAAVVGLERLDTFDPGTAADGGGGFLAWMMQIVRNIARNEGRKRGRRRTSSADSATLDATSAHDVAADRGVLTGTGQVARGEEPFDDELLHALDGLEESARGCLLMRAVLGMSYHDIALALGIPEGTAASHVHRARTTLRQALRPPPPPAARKGGGG